MKEEVFQALITCPQVTDIYCLAYVNFRYEILWWLVFAAVSDSLPHHLDDGSLPSAASPLLIHPMNLLSCASGVTLIE